MPWLFSDYRRCVIARPVYISPYHQQREKPEEEEVIADPADEQVEAEAVNGEEVVADEVMQDDAAEPAEEQ